MNNMENNNHPLTLGTYDWDSYPICNNCNKPTSADNQVLVNEGFKHKVCPTVEKQLLKENTYTIRYYTNKGAIVSMVNAVSPKDAQGKAWAQVLRDYPGAIYVRHEFL